MLRNVKGSHHHFTHPRHPGVVNRAACTQRHSRWNSAQRVQAGRVGLEEQTIMRYPIVIHKDENSSYGVTVPDLPGCFSGR